MDTRFPDPAVRRKLFSAHRFGSADQPQLEMLKAAHFGQQLEVRRSVEAEIERKQFLKRRKDPQVCDVVEAGD